MRHGMFGLVLVALLLAPAVSASEQLLLTDFTNRSYRPEMEWVGVGLAYLVRSYLGQLDGIDVLLDRKPKSNGASPGPDWTVSGEVRDSGGKLMVTVNMDHRGVPEDRKQLLTEGDEQDVFAMAEYMAERIAHHLGLRITPEDRARLGDGMTRRVDAYRAFSLAVMERRLRNKIEHYQRAVALDPGFALAYHHVSRIFIIMRDYRSAGQSLESLVLLRPDWAEAHNDYAYTLAQLGRQEEAAAQYRLAVNLDPESSRYLLNLADVLRYLARSDEAAEAYRQALALDPAAQEALDGLAALGVRVASAEPVAAETGLPQREAPARERPAPKPTPTPAQRAAVAAPTPAPAPRPTPAPTPPPAATGARVTVLPRPSGSVKLSQEVRDELLLAEENARTDRRGRSEALLQRYEAARAAFEAGSEALGYLELGRLYLESGMKHAALNLLKQALERDQTSPDIHRALGEAYQLIGKKKQAREHMALAEGR